MKEAISKILNKLEMQSNLEKTRNAYVSPQDRILAITKETVELLNILLRRINAKNMLEIRTSTRYSTI